MPTSQVWQLLQSFCIAYTLSWFEPFGILRLNISRILNISWAQDCTESGEGRAKNQEPPLWVQPHNFFVLESYWIGACNHYFRLLEALELHLRVSLSLPHPPTTKNNRKLIKKSLERGSPRGHIFAPRLSEFHQSTIDRNFKAAEFGKRFRGGLEEG